MYLAQGKGAVVSAHFGPRALRLWIPIERVKARPRYAAANQNVAVNMRQTV